MDSRERIFAVLDELNMEQKELARLLEIPADTVSAWRRKKSASYTKYLPQIAEALGTTTEYLLTGNGPKKKTVPAKMSDSDTCPDWLIKFKELSPSAQKEVIAFIEFKRSQE